MPIKRTSSPALARLAQSSSTTGRGLLGRNLESMQRTKERRRAIFDNMFADWKRRKDTPAYDEGGGATGAGIGAAIPLIAAPFTGGASLAFLPAATAAGGAIGTAVDKPSGPGAAAASRQKQGAISMAAPFAAGGMSALGGQGFGAGYKRATRGPGYDPVIVPSPQGDVREPSLPPPAMQGGAVARGTGSQWPSFQEIAAMTPAQRATLDPRINEVYEFLMTQDGSGGGLLQTPIDRWRQQNPMPFTGGAY